MFSSRVVIFILALIVVACKAFSSVGNKGVTRHFVRMTSEIVVKKASTEDLANLKIRTWPTWGCGVSKFPWSYDSTETSYFLKGKVVVTPNGGQPVTIQAGDIAVFPSGMSCVWDVQESIMKHYNFS